MTSIFNKLLTAPQIKCQGGALNNGREIDTPRDFHRTKAWEILPAHPPQWVLLHSFLLFVGAPFTACTISWKYSTRFKAALSSLQCEALLWSSVFLTQQWCLPCSEQTWWICVTLLQLEQHRSRDASCDSAFAGAWIIMMCGCTVVAKRGRMWKGNDTDWKGRTGLKGLG